MLAAPLEQPAVGRVGDRLQHDGRVHDDPLEAGLLDEAAAARRLDGDLEQRLDTRFADATAPARQARRVDRRLGLQVRLAGEVLPIRIFHPGVDHCFVGGREGVLQVQQPRHQPGRQCRTAARRHEVSAEAAFDLRPVDQRGQPSQRVAEIDLLVQPWPQRLVLQRCPRLRPHPQPRRKLQEICLGHNATAQTKQRASDESTKQINGLGIVQDGLRSFRAGRTWQRIGFGDCRGTVLSIGPK